MTVWRVGLYSYRCTHLSVKVDIRQFLGLCGMSSGQRVKVISHLDNAGTVEPVAEGQGSQNLSQLGEKAVKRFLN